MKYPVEYPNASTVIVEVRQKNWERWSTAMFYWNGKRPVFAQYGTEITADVTEWRKKEKKKQKGRG